MAPSDAELRTQLRDAGLRATPARLAVLRILHDRTGAGHERTSAERTGPNARPSSHPEVFAALQQDGWDRATLYRNLVDLTEAGLLRRVDLGDHVWRYELLSVPAPAHHDEDHPHFLCTVCGDVSCLEGVALRELGMAPGELPDAVRAGRVSIQLRGRCDRCAAAA